MNQIPRNESVDEVNLKKRAVKILQSEIKLKMVGSISWNDKGSRKNNKLDESQINLVLNESSRTRQTNSMERSTTEIGYLVLTESGNIEVQVFGRAVDELKSDSVKQIKDRVTESVPVVVFLFHIFAYAADRLPDRYSIGLSVRDKKLPSLDS